MERREGTIKKLSSEVLKANALLGGAQEKVPFWRVHIEPQRNGGSRIATVGMSDGQY